MDGSDLGIGAVALTIVTTIATATWKITRYLAKKFFDDENGYVPNYLKKHYELIDVLKDREKLQTDLCQQHAEQLGGTSKDVAAIKNAGREACQLCRELLPDPTDSTAARLTRIEQVLTE